MTMPVVIEEVGKVGSVDEVAIVSEADAVRAVDVERLGLGVCAGAGGRIADCCV